MITAPTARRAPTQDDDLPPRTRTSTAMI